MKKIKQTSTWQVVVIGLVISTILTLLIDYLLPTPWNFRFEGTWIKLFFILMIYTTINAIALGTAQAKHTIAKNEKLINYPFILPLIMASVMAPAFFICMLTGAQIFHAPYRCNIYGCG